MKKILILVFTVFLFLISCASVQKKDQNDLEIIVNILLEQAGKTRDSIYIRDWGTKKELVNQGKANDFKKQKILTIQSDSIHFEGFMKFLNSQGIDYTKQILYFEEQLKTPIVLNKEKITNKKVRVNPFDSDPYNLDYDKDYKITGYYFELPRPVFTLDGNSAITYQKKKDSMNHFTLFKKTNGVWEATIDYFYGVPAME